jgi:hypothetical protein
MQFAIIPGVTVANDCPLPLLAVVNVCVCAVADTSIFAVEKPPPVLLAE